MSLKNRLIDVGKSVLIEIQRNNGEVFYTSISKKDLPKLLKLNRTLYLMYNRRDKIYYVFYKHSNKHKVFTRYLLELEDPQLEVDHVNRNTLDNRRQNLRIVSKNVNCINKTPRNNTGTKGVYYRADGNRKNRYHAFLRFNGKRIVSKFFHTQEEAKICIDEVL